jgi:hypothetical protein
VQEDDGQGRAASWLEPGMLWGGPRQGAGAAIALLLGSLRT